MALIFISFVTTVLPFGICCYYWTLLIAAFLKKEPPSNKKKIEFTQIAIVIPAHNEEKIIAETLKSCKRLCYPKDKYDIFVIIDNCSDNTAKVVLENGVNFLKRDDDKHKGKGYALAWAFAKLTKERYDLFVVLDADCKISTNALKLINKKFLSGAEVIQINYKTSNPDETPISYVCAIGNHIENTFFYKPKGKLNISVFLRGTGMAFSKAILLKNPWTSFGIVEDIEYSLKMIQQKIKTHFIDKAEVISDFPSQMNQLSIQRARWGGGLSLGKLNAIRFIINGIKQNNFDMIDIGFTFISSSKPLVIMLSIFAVLLSGMSNALYNNWMSQLVFIFSMLCFVSIISYLILGILSFGLSIRRFTLLLSTPIVLAKLITISLRSLFKKPVQDWEKTPRND